MAQPPDEQALVEAARSDPRRFAEVYEIYFDRVYAYAVRRLRNREAAEDVTADVFHQALAALPTFEWRGAPFAAWLYRIAGNAIADHCRRRGREAEIEPERIEGGDDVEASERSARLFGLVRELPADQRRVIELRFGEGWSLREVAEEMGRSEGAIKQLQLRGLLGLRARMGVSHG